VEALAQYGHNLGVAFQIVDDLLDYTADERVLGKATGTDLREGNLTLPVICALNRATSDDRNRMETIIGDPDLAREEFDSILDLIIKYGGIEYSKDRAQEHVDQAKTCLDIFEASKPRALLKDLADYVPARKM
jgi:octaprenyl-diphosphate synthase